MAEETVAITQRRPSRDRDLHLRDHSNVYYTTWHNMIARCYLETTTDHELYARKGVEVYAAWHDFDTFVDDILGLLGPRPEGMTLDRIDNDGHYEVGNVRWATARTQIHNRGLMPKRMSASRFRGVTVNSQSKAKPWKAFGNYQGSRYHLGYHQTEEEAARAHDEWARSLFGPNYPGLNFPAERKNDVG